MNRCLALALLTVGLAIAAGGYWIGSSAEPAAAEQGRRVLYYRDPMGRPEYSAEPKKDSMGMDYIPVYEGEENGSQAPAISATPAAVAKGKILYYRNPMGLPDT